MITVFLLHDAMLAWYMLSLCVCPSICLTVHLSEVGCFTKMANLGSCRQPCMIAQGF